jgi:hypothetical protein
MTGGSIGGPDCSAGALSTTALDICTDSSGFTLLLRVELLDVVLAFPGDDAEVGRSSSVLISTLPTTLALLPAHVDVERVELPDNAPVSRLTPRPGKVVVKCRSVEYSYRGMINMKQCRALL